MDNGLSALLAAAILGFGLWGFVIQAERAILHFRNWLKTHPSVRLSKKSLSQSVEDRQKLVDRRLAQCSEQVEAFAVAEFAWLATRRATVVARTR